nr:monodehydroascorbate reductase [Tanacetum cinerariifolium]
MADVNVNALAGQAPTMAPPVRTDDQILPHIRWVPIGINCYLDVEKSQSNPIYKIAVDILKDANFFRAFTASSTIPSIYIQQFWDTVRYDKSAGCYRCQLDEQWFDLAKDTLRDVLQITPVNDNQAFTSPPSSDALINFVNDLGYPKLVENLSNVVTNDMFQPWRELTTIINLCLMGNTSGFERPRAPVLQILWGVVTRAHIDYAERIWEEFTQSIHTFIKGKRNLAQRTHGKKKATLIVISSIHFSKLIIYHLQRQHKFYPRPDSLLHFPNEEPVLGYLKLSAKGTKREVFRMPIPGSLITADIQEASYYQEYLAKVAKHQRYLAGETWSDPNSPAPNPTKTAKKPKPIAPKADPRPPVSKPASTKQPEPKSAPAKTQGKKHKLTTEISDKPYKAKKSRLGSVSKRRKPVSSLRALEESMKSMYDVPQGLLPPVVIREPESEKYQPLPEVPRKGKEKDGPDLGAQDEGQVRSHPDEQAEGQAGPDPGNAEESQPIPSLVVHAGSDREHMDLCVVDVSPQPPPEQMDEGFTATAYPKVQKNLKLTVEEQVLLEEPASSSGTLSSLQHLTKDLSFSDLFFSNKPSEADNDKATAKTEAESMVSVMIQQDMSSIPSMTTPIIDFTLRSESPMRIGELKHIMADLIQENNRLKKRLDSHGARLYTLKQLDIPHQVSKAIDEVVTDAVDWAMQAPLRNRFRDLPKADMKEIIHQCMWETDSYKSHEDHMQYEALEKSMNHNHSEELAKELAEARKKKKKSRESPKTPPGSPPHQPPPPPPPAGPSRASGSPGSSGSSQVPPPPHPPPSTNQEGQSKGSAAPSSSKTAASAEYQAWTTTDIRLRPSISLTPANLQMDEDMPIDEQAQSSDDEDIGNAHIPKVNLWQDWWKALEKERPATPKPAWSIPSSDVPVPMNKWASALASNYSPPPKDSLLAQTGDIAMFMDWLCKRRGITKLKPQDLEGPSFEIIKVFHPDVIHLQYQMEECHKILTDSVEDLILRHNVKYLRYGSKGSRPALSISKIKAAYYPDVGLEQMVPEQIHTSKGDRRAVRTHMRILSVVRIEVFSLYVYDYMKKIVLRHANLNEHVIAKRDYKYLYPSDFEDLYLLNLQGQLNHLPPKDKKILTTAVNVWTRNLVIRQRVEDFQLGIESYQTQLNLTKPRWDDTGFEYKHDYTVIDSPRAVTFRDRYGVQMIMCFNEIHKFNDGTLQQIDEALDYQVKEFKINRMNPGLNTRF